MGAVIVQERSRVRAPDIQVRVGSYDFDHTGHIYSGIYTGSQFDRSWPLDDNYPNLRDALWLATDRAYKTASGIDGAKTRGAERRQCAGRKAGRFFACRAGEKHLQSRAGKKSTKPAWTARTVKLSAIFNSYPEVLASSVDVSGHRGHHLPDEQRRHHAALSRQRGGSGCVRGRPGAGRDDAAGFRGHSSGPMSTSFLPKAK